MRLGRVVGAAVQVTRLLACWADGMREVANATPTAGRLLKTGAMHIVMFRIRLYTRKSLVVGNLITRWWIPTDVPWCSERPQATLTCLQ